MEAATTPTLLIERTPIGYSDLKDIFGARAAISAIRV